MPTASSMRCVSKDSMRTRWLFLTAIVSIAAVAPHGVSDERLVAIVRSDDPQALMAALDHDGAGIQRVVGFDQEERGDMLTVAAFQGSTRIVSALLKAGADVNGEPAIANGTNLKRHTPLFLAAYRGHVDTVQTLLSAGASFAITDGAGYGPLDAAAAFGQRTVVNLLIDAGVPIDARSRRGDTPLKLAVMRKQDATAEYLLDRAADPNVSDVRGDTALHEAARNDDARLVQILLDRGAHESMNQYGRTPSDEARAWGPSVRDKRLLLHESSSFGR